MPRPKFSLIVPTRHRPEPLRRFLHSVATTTSRRDEVEVILVLDADDPVSAAVRHPWLTIRPVIGPPGRTMGSLNTAGYEASKGQYVMLLNDDVVIRTRGWDAAALDAFRQFPDPFALVHVNDTLIRDYLCTFPLVSREFCELAGGICPTSYRRYRIDDHIEDVFNLLNVLGEKRSVYLPDVVFEHMNAVEHPQAGRVYMSDPEILAVDAAYFEQTFAERKELALRVLEQIEGGNDPELTELQRSKLDAITDSFDLRTTGRQHVMRAAWWKRDPAIGKRAAQVVGRLKTRYRMEGSRGLLQAAGRNVVKAFS